jgi:hypothetical protein
MSDRSFTIERAFRDQRLFSAALGSPTSWQAWLTVLCAAFALPLTAQQRQVFATFAGGRQPPAKLVRELWVVAGRRSGKSRIAALIAVFIALFVKHRVSPGERPMVLVIAGSVDQARTVFGYVRGFLEAASALAKEVAAVKAHEIELKNGIVIAVHSNSFRTVRGRTLVAAIFDEVSFWRDESSASPDVEVYRAVLPSLATTNGMLVGISTPYRKLGLLHQKHRDHFGVDDADVLVVQGSSKTFNPSLNDAVIAAQRAADPTAAGAEWDAEFRSDIGAFLDDALIDRAVEIDRPLELPPTDGGDERAAVAYQAHADGDPKARAKLDKINAEAVAHASELASIDAALKTAAEHLAAAKAQEAREQQRQREIEWQKEAMALREDFETLDDAAADLAEAARNARDRLSRMRQLGPTPSDQQFLALGARALKSALMSTPWMDYELGPVPPSERRNFMSLFNNWIGSKLGGQDQEAA